MRGIPRHSAGALGLLVMIMSVACADAATLRKVTPVEYLDCDYRIEGEFKPGDDVDIIAQLRTASFSVICLNSPGGNLATALNVAEFIVGEGKAGRHSFMTMVRHGDTCASACAVLFMSGNNNEEAVYPSRRIEAGGKVCFHQPFSSLATADRERKFTGEDLALFLDVTVGQVNRIVKLSNQFYEANFANWQDDYAAFPSVLLKDLLATPPQKLLCVETISQFARYRIEPVVSAQGQINGLSARENRDSEAKQATHACQNYLSAFFPEGFYDTSRTRFGRDIATKMLDGQTVYEVDGFNYSSFTSGGFPCYVSGIGQVQPSAWLSLEGEGDRRQWYERSNDAVRLPDWFIFDPDESISDIGTAAKTRPTATPAPEAGTLQRQTGDWLVIMASGRSEAEVEAKSRAAGSVPGARIVPTDQFNNLSPGLYALVSGPWTKSDAAAIAEIARRSLSDAYIKRAYR